MKIGCGICYWDDPQGLLRILESDFYQKVHTVFLIDGRYKGREDKEENDPTLGQQIAKHYDKVHYVRMYNAKQIEKRNKYWELAEKYDMDLMFVIDSDVIPIINEDFDKGMTIAMQFEDTQCFPLYCDNCGIQKRTVRLFRKPFDFRHRQNKNVNISHSQIFKDHGKGNEDIHSTHQKFLDEFGQNRAIKGIVLVHDKSFRSKKRLDWDYVYYANNPTR